MFQHHPDGYITIGEITVALDWFLAQEPDYHLPDDAIARRYIPDKIHTLTKLNAHDEPYQADGGLDTDKKWAEGDGYLSKEAQYTTNYSEYLNPAPTLDEIKKDKIFELKSRVQAEIFSGFVSNALEADHQYDSEQHNIDWIQAAALSSTGTLITCDDQQGKPDSKQPRLHTRAQSKLVLKAGMAALLAHKTKFRDLRDQVMAAAEAVEVDAVEW